MEDRETPRMHKYGEIKTTRIMMASVRHVTSCSELRKFQAAWFLLNIGYGVASSCVLLISRWCFRSVMRSSWLLLS